MAKSKTKKSIFNLVTSILLKLVTIAFGIILPKLFITTYGSEINGLQSSVTQIFTYIALLEGGIGAATLQSLYAPTKKKDKGTINSYLSAASRYYNKIGIIYFAILFATAFIYAAVVKVTSLNFWFVVLYVVISGSLTGINFFFQAKLNLFISANGEEYISSTAHLISYVSTSIIKVLLIPYVNIIILQSAYLGVHLLETLVFFIIYKKKYPWLSFKTLPDYSCLKQKNSVLVHKISSIIFQNIDIILLTFFCSLEIVSIYTIYKMVVNMINSLVSTFGNSVNFVLGQSFNDEEDTNKVRYKKLIDTFDVYYSAISFSLYSVMFVLIIPFLKLYTHGMDLNYIYLVLPYLYIAIEILTVGRESMMRTIDVAGHFRQTQWRALLESAINLSFSIVAILVFKHFYGMIGGLYGTLLGTIVSMFYRTTDIIIYGNKKLLNRKPRKSFKIMLINLLTFIIFVMFINKANLVFHSYLSLFLNAIWITLFSVLLFLLTQSFANQEEYYIFKQKVKRMFVRKRAKGV